MKTDRRPGQEKPNHILAIVKDEHSCHAMTEELLDTWWNAMAPEEKADIYLASLGEPEMKAAPFVPTSGFLPTSDATLEAMNELKRQIAQALQRPATALPAATQH